MVDTVKDLPPSDFRLNRGQTRFNSPCLLGFSFVFRVIFNFFLFIYFRYGKVIPHIVVVGGVVVVVLIFSILNHPCSFMAFCYLRLFFFLVNYYFQVYFSQENMI